MPSSLAAPIGPLVLGAAATGYLATTTNGTAGAAGAVLIALDRAKDFLLANAQAAAVTGAAAVVAASAGGLLVVHHNRLTNSDDDGTAVSRSIAGSTHAGASTPALAQPPTRQRARRESGVR